MSKNSLLDGLVKTRIFGKRVEVTYREYCKSVGIPEEIMLWRLSKNMSPHKTFARPQHILIYNGKHYTPTMLSEVSGVSASALVNRWANGIRGDRLVAKETTPNPAHDPEKIREKAIKECREHLRTLFYAHPERREHARRKVIKKELDPFDEGQARINAQRFEAMAWAGIRQTGEAA